MFAACTRVEVRISRSTPCVRCLARRHFRVFASEVVPLRLSCVFFRRGWYGFLTFSSLVLPFAFFLLVHSALPATRSFLRSIGPVPRAGVWNADCETVRSLGSFSSAPPLLVPPTCTSTSTSSTCVSPARLCSPIRLFFTWLHARPCEPKHVFPCDLAARTAARRRLLRLVRRGPLPRPFLGFLEVPFRRSFASLSTRTCKNARRALLRALLSCCDRSTRGRRPKREFLLRRGPGWRRREGKRIPSNGEREGRGSKCPGG